MINEVHSIKLDLNYIVLFYIGLSVFPNINYIFQYEIYLALMQLLLSTVYVIHTKLSRQNDKI